MVHNDRKTMEMYTHSIKSAFFLPGKFFEQMKEDVPAVIGGTPAHPWQGTSQLGLVQTEPENKKKKKKKKKKK